jgi:primosomal protein N'
MKNLYNAALLLRDDITTVAVTFDGPKLSSGPKRYNYVVTREQAKVLKKGSRVLVNGSMSGDAVATVAAVHAEAKIDLNSARKYKTVLAVIDDDAVRDFEAQTAAIAERIRERQNTNTRGQLLAALGLTSEDVAKLQSQTFDDDFDSSDDVI